MMNDDFEPDQTDFNDLSPDAVLDLVEAALGVRCSNICRQLNSYINRVYEVHLDDGDVVIAKFYRPRRWSARAIQEEHDFLRELAADEIPVIAPLTVDGGPSLHTRDDLHYAIFPRLGGRTCDEPNAEQWQELGRLIGRMHCVGAASDCVERIRMAPDRSTADHIDYIIGSGIVPSGELARYEDAARQTVDLILPLFADAPAIRIHGDLHHQNVIYRPEESFYLIDFDDMAMGPPVQDLWMVLPGRRVDCRAELDALLDGYETFASFDYSTFRLIEPLRAMRFIHFTAWCVQQRKDGGFSRLAADWGTREYWSQEVNELLKQQQEIHDSLP